jgi:hypothetical protein
MAAPVRLYPVLASRRNAVIARDLLCVLLIAFFCWCGVKTFQAVDHLTVFGTAVSDTGTSIQKGFGSAADAVGSVPIVGDKLANALNGAGSGTGGNLASLAQQGNDRIHSLALLLGWMMALLPSVVLLLAVLPGRIRQVRSMGAAQVVLANRADPALRQLIASRAAFGLPYDVLLGYTRDPLGDLAEGRYDALVRATLEQAGLPAVSAGSPAAA